MKRAKNIYMAAAAIAALVIGFVIGISINYPNVNNNEISGTIGKVNKYRDVQMSEADIQLRSYLLNDEQLKQRYEDYYAMHYALAVEQSERIDFAIEAATQNELFAGNNANAIKQLELFRNKLDEARANILLANSAVKSLTPDITGIVMDAINQANITISQIDYNNTAVIEFVEALNNFILDRDGNVSAKLLEAHDLLTMNQLTKALLTNNKPMLKYLDEKSIYTKQEDMGAVYASTEIMEFMIHDTERLNVYLGQETFDLLVLLNSNESLKLMYNDINKLESNLHDTEVLKFGFPSQSNSLQDVSLLNTEKLNMFNDKDFLNSSINDSEFLKGIIFNNQEQLGLYNHEVLHFW
jgi:hypothetical protein